jgi:hypothetical protein
MVFDLEEMKLSKNQTVEGLDVWFENTMLKSDLVTDYQVLIYQWQTRVNDNVIIEVENA